MKRIIITSLLAVAAIVLISNSKPVIRIGFPLKYENLVVEQSQIYGLDPLLIYSVMRAESKYDKDAVSYADAKGLMQLTDDTFAVIRDNISIGDDVFDPKTNITGGIWYLSYLYENTNDIYETVKAYNSGLMNLDKKIPQTVIFSARVFEFYEIYKHLYSD